MTWNLFIDDKRTLTDVTWAPWHVQEKYRNEEWVIARSYAEATARVLRDGFPSCISFDHDLGNDQLTGYDIAKTLVETDMDNRKWQFPSDFSFYVHSQNPIGKANIEGLLNNYLKHRDQK